MTERRRVVVVGGGIAGLAAALELCRAPGAPEVLVIEAADYLGGKLRSARVGARPVDVGPDSFVARRPEVFELCAELGIGSQIVGPGASGAEVYARGQLRQLPPGLAMGIPTRLFPLARSGLLSTRGLLGPLADLTGIPSLARRVGARRRGARDERYEDEAIGSIVERHFGHEVKEVLADPLIGGIHASSTDNLSAASVFPPLMSASLERGSLMRSLRASGGAGGRRTRAEQAPMFATLVGGMASIAGKLGEQIMACGATCLTGARVEAVDREGSSWVLHLSGAKRPASTHLDRAVNEREDEPDAHASDASGIPGNAARASSVPPGHTGRFAGTSVRADALVLALPAFEAARLLRPHSRDLAGALASIPYASVSIATFLFDEQGFRARSRGTGFLVPASSGLHMTACTWLDVKWPHLHQPLTRLVRVSAGRFGDIRHELLDDEKLADVLLADLRRTAGVDHSPAEAVVTRWPDSFPQYRPGHAKLVSLIEGEASRLPLLALAGAPYQGIGVPACVKSGREAARGILARLGSESLEDEWATGVATHS